MWKGKLLHAAETLRYMSCLYSFAVSRADSTSPSIIRLILQTPHQLLHASSRTAYISIIEEKAAAIT
jgi:hypothetical protein